MLDTRSDYALNKLDKTAIVCQSVTGDHICLTLEDFSSEEEFAYWKKWSDDDYHNSEIAGWKDSICLSFESQRDAQVPSAEEIVLRPYIAAEQAERRRQRLEQIRKILTPKQYRRMCLRHIRSLSVEKIADMEEVTPQAIYACLSKAEEMIVNNL